MDWCVVYFQVTRNGHIKRQEWNQPKSKAVCSAGRRDGGVRLPEPFGAQPVS